MGSGLSLYIGCDVEHGMKEYSRPRDPTPWRLAVAQTLPYLSSNKNLPKLFEKILSAQKGGPSTECYLPRDRYPRRRSRPR
jgi:hypothetical protein